MAAYNAALLSDTQELAASYGILAVAALLLLAYAVFVIAAFVGALASNLSGGMKLVWAVFIVCAPFIGSLCWFLIGRNNVPTRAYY